MSWPCADMSKQHWDDRPPLWSTHHCRHCGHVACYVTGPCETCATNRRIDQLIGDDR